MVTFFFPIWIYGIQIYYLKNSTGYPKKCALLDSQQVLIALQFCFSKQINLKHGKKKWKVQNCWLSHWQFLKLNIKFQNINQHEMYTQTFLFKSQNFHACLNLLSEKFNLFSHILELYPTAVQAEGLSSPVPWRPLNGLLSLAVLISAVVQYSSTGKYGE